MQRLKALGLRLLEVWRKKIQNSEEGEEEGSGEKKTKKNKNKNKENSYMTAAAKALAAVKICYPVFFKILVNWFV